MDNFYKHKLKKYWRYRKLIVFCIKKRPLGDFIIKFGDITTQFQKRKCGPPPEAPQGETWCQLSDLNQRPSDYKSDALPAELNWQCEQIIYFLFDNFKCFFMRACFS